MIFKVEIIKDEQGEEWLYQNPYLDKDIAIASTEEGVLSDATAYVLGKSEVVAFKAGKGFIAYLRTLPDALWAEKCAEIAKSQEEKLSELGRKLCERQNAKK